MPPEVGQARANSRLVEFLSILFTCLSGCIFCVGLRDKLEIKSGNPSPLYLEMFPIPCVFTYLGQSMQVAGPAISAVLLCGSADALPSLRSVGALSSKDSKVRGDTGSSGTEK